MYFCYSTVFSTLRKYTVCKSPVKSLFIAIWKCALLGKFDIEDDENSYKYHKGIEIPNIIKNRVNTISISNIETWVHSKLIPILDNDHLLDIIQTINILIEHEFDISDDTILCTNPLYTKRDFLNKTAWEFEQYISIVLKYVFTNHNEIDKDSIKDIVKWAESNISECFSKNLIGRRFPTTLPV